jgi:iron complex outermembrane recepter protein
MGEDRTTPPGAAAVPFKSNKTEGSDMPDNMLSKSTTVLLATLSAGAALGDQDTPTQVLDEVSVTATREARATKDVPQSIAVIGQQKIEDAKMQNVKDAIQGTPGVLIDSKNGGYDARLIIRGAGLKAPYGIREIMVLRDGVPMTDPDSFTRLDFIDTQDIERIEITKGPGDLFSTGSAGGAIQIISKSVFDDSGNRVRVGGGNFETRSYNVRYGGMVSDNQAFAVTASRRSSDNNWRLWNQFDTSQLSVKHGVQLDSHSAWESEVSYSEANLQLPGSMSAAQFEDFKNTGEQTATQDVWKSSGRYSKIWFFNTKYEQQIGDLTFKPRLYYNQWKHYHPVTGLINDSGDWAKVFGTDLEAHYRHQVAGNDARLVTGVTLRQDRTDDARKYEYRDYTALPTGRITSTLTDEKGTLASVSNSKNTIYGVFAQESLRPTRRVLIDAGFRYDRSKFDVDEDEYWAYDYASGKYIAGAGPSTTKRTYNLFAPKIGVSYEVTDRLSGYATVARASQVPSESEVTSNPDINAAKSTNYEIGLKGRMARWSFDTAIYVNPVRDEIIQVRQDTQTVYVNAGRTDKKGFEFSGTHALTDRMQVGLNYAYSNYKFAEFTEPVRVGAITTNVDRTGNYLPYVPKHQYGVSFGYHRPEGFQLAVSANSWGRYFLDNANSETYGGYKWVTNVTLGYEHGRHSLSVNLDNAFGDRYAMEVKKDTNGSVSYYAASPRTWLLTYTYKLSPQATGGR